MRQSDEAWVVPDKVVWGVVGFLAGAASTVWAVRFMFFGIL